MMSGTSGGTLKRAITFGQSLDFSILHATLDDLSIAYRQIHSLAELRNCPPGHDYLFLELAVLEEYVRGQDLAAAIESLKEKSLGSKLILITQIAQMRACYTALKMGADNYLAEPLAAEEVRFVLESEAQVERLKTELKELGGGPARGLPVFLGQTKNPLVQKIFDQALAVAGTRSTVFITGESGTGKGVLARYIHEISSRSSERFLAIHCGAMPEALIESELFGHEKGAFTGALKRKLGKFELAHKGTLFLDEIGTIGPGLQVKLLQVLQDRVIQRVGGEEEIPVDVRIIAATNSNVLELVKEGKFREDLYYRLNVFPIELPPLRERKEDLELLVQSILTKLTHTHGKVFKGVESSVLRALGHYSWPGNIRELENILERACILERGEWLTEQSFPADFFIDPASSAPRDAPIADLATYRQQVSNEAEKRYLLELLEVSQGHIARASEIAGVSTRQLHKLLLKHQMKFKKQFKLD